MRVSVIIPTLNEAGHIGSTLERIRRDDPAEIIVVDGGSEDGTPVIAEHWARVVASARGRAVQQNVGAEAATGDVLLFLHADCWPELGWQKAIRRAVKREHFGAGAFQMQIEGARSIYRAIERGGDLRVRWLGLPYGDQGIFLRRESFWNLGGFPQVALMEDVLFMQRARRLGRVELVRHPIHISPRRWERAGVVRQTLRNWGLIALAIGCGVHPDRLAEFYPAVR